MKSPLPGQLSSSFVFIFFFLFLFLSCSLLSGFNFLGSAPVSQQSDADVLHAMGGFAAVNNTTTRRSFQVDLGGPQEVLVDSFFD